MSDAESSESGAAEDPTRWAQIKDIVADAFELDGDARRALVETRCAGDDELRREVESLLGEGEGDSGDFLDRPATAMFEVPAPELGTSVGRYELRSVIGEGGMGRVYEAVQEHPHRTVALKVLRPGFLSGDAERRFQWEVEALGRLSHPGIAGVLEAGFHGGEGGHAVSWFAMEKVDGRPLTEAADTLGLDRAGRLELFLRVADAITHAHQRGVIHRDLKPDNILVDDEGQPHVLDFGIARAADPLASAVTTAGEIVGTLAYMSPEQVLGEPEKVDAQSDVYALGVLLYRLLTGRAPLALEGLPLPKVALRLSEDDPVPAGDVDRALKGDLETILQTALARDPGRRYPTVDAFAGDVRRWLADEPITARAPTTWYQLTKFAARHKGLVAGMLLAFVVAVAAAIVSSIAFVRADDARVLAQEEEQRAKDARDVAEEARRLALIQRDRAEDASFFLATVLSSPAPDFAGRDIRVIDMLQGASEELYGREDLDPVVGAVLHNTLGETYRRLGALQEARRHLEDAIAAFEGMPEDELSLLEAHGALAEVLLDLDEPEAALRSIARVKEGRRSPGEVPVWLQVRPLELEAAMAAYTGDVDVRITATKALLEAWGEHSAPGADTLETARNNHANALISAGRFDEADALLVAGIEGMRGTEAEGGVRQLTQEGNRATIAADLQQWNRADELTEALVPRFLEIFGERHQKSLALRNTRANVLIQLGRTAEGRDVYKELLELHVEVYGADNDETVIARNNLAVAQLYLEEHGAAAETIRPAVELLGGERGVANPIMALQVRMTYANALDGLGQVAEALPVYQAVVAQLEELAGEGHPQTLISRNSLVVLLMKLGRHAESIALGERNIELAKVHQPSARMIEFPFRSNLGRALAAAGKFEQAEAEFLAVDAFLSADADTTTRETERLAELLAAMYEQWGKPGEAGRWRGQ